MNELKNIISEPEKRQAVIMDCVALINSEVKSKTGLSGAAVKAAFAVVKAIKPRILEESVDSLLDEFVAALQPHYAEYQAAGCPGNLEQYLNQHNEGVADSLLAITDVRAERSKNKTMVKAYYKLRPKGRVHVIQAVPGVGRVLDKHVPACS